MKNRLLSLKFEFGTILGLSPALFFFVQRLLKPKKVNYLVNHNTDIVIEGFPRSGNTFAVAAFTLAQPNPMVIARHTHKVAQIIVAVRRQIPTLVIIREPIEAVTSLVIRQQHLSLEIALKSYIRYYSHIMPYQYGFVVADFNEVISDFGQSIKKINEHFNTAFSPFYHTQDNVEKCFEIVDAMDRSDTGKNTVTITKVARPSSSRAKLKQLLMKQIKQPRLQKLLTSAQDLYKSYS